MNIVLFKHPSTVCMSYIEHCQFSLHMACAFFYGGFFAIIHAFIPDMFIKTTTETNQYIFEKLKNAGCRD